MTTKAMSNLTDDMQTVFAVLGFGLADLLQECDPSERVPLLVANVKRRSLEHMSTEKLVPFYRALGNLIQELS